MIAMGLLEAVQLDGDLVAAARRRADQEGVQLTEYLSDVVRRALERQPHDESVLVYDHVREGDLPIERTDEESEAGHRRRSELYGRLFGA